MTSGFLISFTIASVLQAQGISSCVGDPRPRDLPCPADELQQGLGWSVEGSVDPARLKQMGLEAHVRLQPQAAPETVPSAESEV